MIIKKFEEIVERFPGKAALKTGSKSLTYAELNFNANRVAHAIEENDKEVGTGTAPGVKTQQVALLFDYGSDMIVGLLGALKANKTYVPMDFSYPGKRLLSILEDSGTYLILTDNQNFSLACELCDYADAKISVLNINTIGDKIPGTAIEREASEEETAYILYTSGSTGKPKGVFQTHRNVLYYARNWIKRVPITESDRMSLFTAFTHDGAIPDIYSALLSGACLYPYSMKENGSVEELCGLLAAEKITIWHSTPTLFRYFTGVLKGNDHFPHVRRVLLGGEPLRPHDLELYKTYFAGAYLVNVYGQTESTVSSLCVIDPQNTFDDVSLGEPLDETKIILMDEDGDMVEEIGGGEIVVACDYVAPGYWKDKENSEKVFLHDEHRGHLYRTGDMGLFTAQGSIKMVGRKDFQVKIRGFRIELGEIETALLQHYAVNEAIVIARLDENNDNYLCAYIVSSQAISSEDLREYLFSELPDYMVPRYFIFLEKMPVTSSGKIDRQRLPEPGKVLEPGSTYVPPANEIEEKVAVIWQEVLKVEKIGVNDNFIELGGHSLLVMSIIAKIHRALNVELCLVDVFGNPTIKQLSHMIMESKQTIFSSIEPVEEKEYYLLSSAQKRLYVLQQMSPDGTAYNMPEVIPLPAGYERQKMEAAFMELINRHESLRTSFHMVNDTPVQVVHDKVEFKIEYFATEEHGQTRTLSKVFGPTFFQKGGTPGRGSLLRFIQPFDLSQAPLLRAGLVTNSDGSYILLIDMHHIISDGVSHEILVRDYQALFNEKKIPPLRLQYKDFSQWQNGEKEKESFRRQEEFWIKEFEGEIPVLDLPTDYPRPLVQSFEGNAVTFEMTAEETRALTALALMGNATLFMVLAATLNILLSKLSGQEEIIMGTPLACRMHVDLEKIIGMFVNTLALRNFPVGDRTFRDFLGDVKARLLKVFENQGYPFEELVDKLSVKRDMGRNPLFDIMLVSQDMNTYSAGLDEEPGYESGLASQHGFPVGYQNFNHAVRFDLTLSVMERTRGFFFLFQYCSKLFKKETIIRFIIYFKKIISSVVNEPDIKISAVEIISEEEKKRILDDFNKTEAEYPSEKMIHQLFEEQASRTPDHIAIVGATSVETLRATSLPTPPTHLQITYRQLNEQSNQLAGLLIEKGVLTDNIVGIMMERCIEMVIGIYGILKAGGAYLSINPGYPQERIDYILKDSGTQLLVTTDNKEGEKVRRWEGEKIFLGFIIHHSNHLSSHHSSFIIHHSNQLSYIIYTSGSTGKPKGVMIEHHSLVNRLNWMQRTYPLSKRDTILQKTTFTFDVSVWEIFWWSIVGARLFLLAPGGEKDPELITQTIERNNITTMHFVPSMLSVFLDYLTGSGQQVKKLAGLKQVIASGEALLSVHVDRFNELLNKENGSVLTNLYGPTEATIDVSYFDCSEGKEKEIIPIGKPIDNIRLYILDKHLHIQPVGISGELFISGIGLARGYLNRPELTAEKFKIKNGSGALRVDFHHPSFIIHHSILYRTGDLARWLTDGNIEFIGRIDEQVKIRGFRVEPGEIESRLVKYPGIKQVVVLGLEEKRRDKYICAYIVSDREIGGPELQEYLSKGLPDYMIPFYFVRLEKIPLTSNGKVNHKALPKPELKIGESYTAPRNKVERKLVELWSEILVRDTLHASQLQAAIGIDDNFFELGGHSLKATILVSKIHKVFDVKIPLIEIFKTPRIRQLAEYIKRKSKDFHISIEPVEEKEYYELSPGQKRLYFLEQLVTDNTGYNMPLVMPLEESVELERLESVFKRLIERHESLRTSFITLNEVPFQKILQVVDFSIGCYKIKEETETIPLICSLIKPFKFDTAPLLRVNLIVVGSSRQVLFIDMHHIITDGTSQDILEKEFTALCSGEELSMLRLQYKDYSEWYNRALRQEMVNQQESFWLKEFSDEIPVLNLPTDYPRPKIQGVEGDFVSFSLNGEETGIVKRIVAENDSTIYIFLLAVFNVLLSKLSGQEDIIIGTPIAARRHADLENVIGMLVNTLAMRNYPSGDKVLKEFLQEVRLRTLDAYENQEYPFEVLVEKITVNRDASRNPVFDVMLNLLNQEDYKGNASEQDEQGPYRHIKRTSKFDMNLTAMEIGERFFFTLEYSTSLFKPERIERIIGYYKNILKVLSRDTGLKISEIEIMDQKEREEVLRVSSGVEWLYEGLKTIHGLFEEQVEKTPDRIALIGAAELEAKKRRREEEKIEDEPFGRINAFGRIHLSYRELNEQSNILAGMLIEKGVQPDTIVGIMMERSIEMVAGIFGILKTGGAYLPIDPGYPRERINYMLRDSGAHIIVGDRHESPGELNCQSLLVNCELLMGVTPAPLHHLSFIIHHSGGLAYVIYTSGSTGKPKGVLIQHYSVVNRLNWMQQMYPLGSNDSILQKTPFTFDVSVWELFWWSFYGARLCLLGPGEEKDPAAIIKSIDSNHITTMHFVPSMLNVFLAYLENSLESYRCVALRQVFASGEALGASQVGQFYRLLRENRNSRVTLINLYGPTEATVDVSYYNCSVDHCLDTVTVPIGKPIHNTCLYIVNIDNRLQPIGIAGELCIVGVGLARGYLNRPELTAEKFIDFHHSKLYRTGDLARWLHDGNIEFLGRIDHQVKIRGFRVELGEIENRLLNCPGIKEAVVVVSEEENGDKSICAYFVSDKEYRISGLRDSLSKELPDYMIPPYFVQIEKIPLTSNGKIDRRALPKPELKVGESYIAPRNEIEKKLAGLWSQILGKDALHVSQLQTSIGIDDNFFQLGGHSLKATVLASMINKELNVKLPLAELFKTPTILGLAEYIKGAVEEIHESIIPVEEKEHYVLSFAQQRIYILQQIDLNNTAYNMPEIIPLAEDIDSGRLEESFKKLIMHHDSLRTSFHMIGDQPVQRVHDHVEFKIEYYNLSTDYTDYTDDKDNKILHSSFITHHFIHPFDLSNAPLLRVGFVKTMEGKQYLLVDIHHIISDGISHEILVKDFLVLHDGKVLPPLRIQYKDFAQWQNSQKEVDRIHQQMEYWLKEFEGEIPVLEIPMDYPRPMIQSFEGKSVDFEISAEEILVLNEMALQDGATLFMVLVTAVNILLSKLSGQEEIIIGTPIAGRRHADLEKIIGMFVNTLALRNYPVGDRTFKEFLADVKERVLMAFENQEYPFEELVDKVSVNRDTGRNPLFDVMFVLQNMNTGAIDGGEKNQPKTGISDQPDLPRGYENLAQTAKFDLTFTAVEVRQKTLFSIQYCTKLFKKETIERFISYFKKIVLHVVKEPGIKISDIEIISQEEKRQVLYVFNDTRTGYPKDRTIHQLFEGQVERTPERIAVFGHGQTRTNTDNNMPMAISYRQLHDQSNRLAHLLIEKGVLADNIVGIMLERSVEMIVGIMGILKSGGAYLPIDPEYPQERIDYMLKDCNAKVLLKSEIRISKYETNPNDQKINVQNKNFEDLMVLDFTHLGFEFVSNFVLRASYLIPSNLAYIIYTSGSTGKPKGVMVEHRSVINILLTLQNEYPLEESGTYLFKTSYLFDVSVTELFGWFLGGGRLAVLEKGGEKDPQRIIDAIQNWEVTHINFVPSMFNTFIETLNPQRASKLSSLKYIFLAGETIIPGLVEKFRQFDMKILLENIYGPTEGTIYASKYSLSGWEEIGSIPIGKPLSNIEIYILDKRDHIQPVGVAGEMCIGGAGVARGYLNRQELTAEKFTFFPNFLTSSLPNFLLYRTSDLARWCPDGNIEYLGRIDYQVKVRGFRIELGEIEYVLSTHPGIMDAVAGEKEGNDGKYLCAYVIPKNRKDAEPQNSSILTRELQEYLSNRLPYYMVPGHFVMLEKMPLTPAGKVDRQALSNFKEYSPGSGATYVAPGNDMEKIVADIWKEVLNLEEVGIYDNFFTLGGNSINILKVNSRLEMKLEKSFPVVKMFKYPTVHALASYLLYGDDEVSEVEKEKKIPLKMDRGKDRLKERSRRRYQRN